MADKTNRANTPITIKKYANRRLYNTATSQYVTLDHLCQMVKDNVDFVVYDAKSGDDITRSVLTQIIFEEEGKGHNLLPIRFLRQLIGFYGDSLQSVVPGYLELSMESFSRNQERMRNYLDQTFGATNPFRQFEEMTRQNISYFERAMRMFSPFGAQDEAEGRTAESAGNAAASSGRAEQEIDALKSQLDIIRRQLEELAVRK